MPADPDPSYGTRGWFARQAKDRHPATLHLLKFFAWAHLAEDLRAISQPCGETAIDMVNLLADGPELTAGLRDLLRAKDCFVRAAVDMRED